MWPQRGSSETAEPSSRRPEGRREYLQPIPNCELVLIPGGLNGSIGPFLRRAETEPRALTQRVTCYFQGVSASPIHPGSEARTGSPVPRAKLPRIAPALPPSAAVQPHLGIMVNELSWRSAVRHLASLREGMDRGKQEEVQVPFAEAEFLSITTAILASVLNLNDFKGRSERLPVSGQEGETQARRRTVVVLQDEMRRVLDATRVLLEEFSGLVKGDKDQVSAALEKVRRAEEDVLTLRTALIRELSQVGTLLVNREDLLRAAFAVEDIFGHINGVAFKMSQLQKSSVKNKKYRDSIESLLGMLIDGISKLNESVRALSLNPEQSIQMASQVQQIEKSIDNDYRELVVVVMKTATNVKELITVKEVVQAIEDCSDAMLDASDASTILALGM